MKRKLFVLASVLICALLALNVALVVAQEPEPEVTPTPIVEPTDEPVEEPAAEPVAEPAEEPAVEPTEEPAVEPTEEPAAEPVAPPAPEAPPVAPADVLPAAPVDTGVHNTNSQIINTGSTTATIVIDYYDEGGIKIAAATLTKQVEAGGSWYVYESTNANLGTSFVGSAVLSSDQPIRVVQGHGDTGTVGGREFGKVMNMGFSSGSTNLSLPAIYRNAGGNQLYTRFAIQNTSSSQDATVTARFYDSAGTEVFSQTNAIKPYASRYYYQYDGAVYSALGSGFIGSASVESTQDVVGTVEIWSAVKGWMRSYNGFPTASASTKVYIPRAIWKAGSKELYTFIAVQNVSGPGTQATICATYVGTGAPASPDCQNVTTSHTFYASTAGLPDGFVGAMTFTSTQSMFAIQQEGALGGAQSTAFNGFGDTDAGKSWTLPVFLKFNGAGWFTQYMVQNTTDVTANVRITYSVSSGSYGYDVELAPNEGRLLYASTTPDGDIASGESGGAVLTADQNVNVIMFQNSNNWGTSSDRAGANTAFKED